MTKEEIIKKTIVYDNGGETLDRYTVFTPDGSVFGMSETAQGFNQYVGEDTEIEKGSHLGKRLKSVPTGIEWAVLDRMKDDIYAKGGGFSSFMSKAKSLGKKGLSKTKEAYGKTKQYAKDKVHEQKKKIALDVIYDAKENLPIKRKDIEALDMAYDVVEEKYAKGGGINMDKHIWEGWTVGSFIEALDIEFRYHPKFKSRDEVKKWAMESQPYYKKYIKEVVDYYWDKNQEKYAKGGVVSSWYYSIGGL